MVVIAPQIDGLNSIAGLYHLTFCPLALQSNIMSQMLSIPRTSTLSHMKLADPYSPQKCFD
jgi:hypothetical protein